MALANIAKEAVDAAIREYEQLRADAFLAQYGFASAKRYWLELNGKRYPSKAIAVFPTTTSTAADFSPLRASQGKRRP